MTNNFYNPFMPDLSIRPHGLVFKGSDEGNTTESIPDWYKPFVEKAAGSASDAFSAGELSKVAGFNPTQDDALGALGGAASAAKDQYGVGTEGQDVFRDQALGQGAFSPASTEALRDKAIRDAQSAFAGTGAKLASSGQVGGARAALLGQERDANLAGALATIDYDAQQADRASRSAGATNLLNSSGQLSGQAGDAANYLGTAGDKIQGQKQAELDATYQGLQRLGGLLSGAPVPTQTESGGK